MLGQSEIPAFYERVRRIIDTHSHFGECTEKMRAVARGVGSLREDLDQIKRELELLHEAADEGAIGRSYGGARAHFARPAADAIGATLARLRDMCAGMELRETLYGELSADADILAHLGTKGLAQTFNGPTGKWWRLRRPSEAPSHPIEARSALQAAALEGLTRELAEAADAQPYAARGAGIELQREGGLAGLLLHSTSALALDGGRGSWVPSDGEGHRKNLDEAMGRFPRLVEELEARGLPANVRSAPRRLIREMEGYKQELTEGRACALLLKEEGGRSTLVGREHADQLLAAFEALELACVASRDAAHGTRALRGSKGSAPEGSWLPNADRKAPRDLAQGTDPLDRFVRAGRLPRLLRTFSRVRSVYASLAERARALLADHAFVEEALQDLCQEALPPLLPAREPKASAEALFAAQFAGALNPDDSIGADLFRETGHGGKSFTAHCRLWKDRIGLCPRPRGGEALAFGELCDHQVILPLLLALPQCAIEEDADLHSRRRLFVVEGSKRGRARMVSFAAESIRRLGSGPVFVFSTRGRARELYEDYRTNYQGGPGELAMDETALLYDDDRFADGRRPQLKDSLAARALEQLSFACGKLTLAQKRAFTAAGDGSPLSRLALDSAWAGPIALARRKTVDDLKGALLGRDLKWDQGRLQDAGEGQSTEVPGIAELAMLAALRQSNEASADFLAQVWETHRGSDAYLRTVEYLAREWGSGQPMARAEERRRRRVLAESDDIARGVDADAPLCTYLEQVFEKYQVKDGEDAFHAEQLRLAESFPRHRGGRIYFAPFDSRYLERFRQLATADGPRHSVIVDAADVTGLGELDELLLSDAAFGLALGPHRMAEDAPFARRFVSPSTQTLESRTVGLPDRTRFGREMQLGLARLLDIPPVLQKEGEGTVEVKCIEGVSEVLSLDPAAVIKCANGEFSLNTQLKAGGGSPSFADCSVLVPLTRQAFYSTRDYYRQNYRSHLEQLRPEGGSDAQGVTAYLVRNDRQRAQHLVFFLDGNYAAMERDRDEVGVGCICFLLNEGTPPLLDNFRSVCLFEDTVLPFKSDTSARDALTRLLDLIRWFRSQDKFKTKGVRYACYALRKNLTTVREALAPVDAAPTPPPNSLTSIVETMVAQCITGA